MVDLLEKALSPLEEGNPVVLLGIDYEKAFNRLDRYDCLRQLKRLGASNVSSYISRSFLTNRKMGVKINGVLSDPKGLNGGSPQGSILGCFLYCITTPQITSDLNWAGPLLLTFTPAAAAAASDVARRPPPGPTLHPATMSFPVGTPCLNLTRASGSCPGLLEYLTLAT